MIGYAGKVIIVLTLLFAVMDPLHSEAGLLEWFFGDTFAHDKKAFESALSENTINSYNAFLEKYQDSKYAQKMLDNFKKQIVIRPIEIDAEAPFDPIYFDYQVFFDKDPNLVFFDKKPTLGPIFIYDENKAPFFSELPPQISLEGSFKGQEKRVAILLQEKPTSFSDRQKLSNSVIGGNLQRYFIIDNAAEHSLDIFIDLYISNISSNISVPAKSHFVITLNLANLDADIMYIRVNRKDNNKVIVIEQLSFPIIAGKMRGNMGWYVYNIGKKNKYRVKTSVYRSQ